MKAKYVRIGKTVPTRKRGEEDFYLRFDQFTNLGVIAQPRYGKGGIAKPLVVQLSHERPICIFDFKGEWGRHTTHPNYESDQPDYIGEYGVYRGFTMPMRDFQLTQDWVSMGFGNGAEQLRNLFVDTWRIHRGLPKRFIEIIMELPVKESQIASFNAKYGDVIRGAFNWQYVQEYKNHAPHRFKWFWQGKDDPRPIYDFTQEWVAKKNIFIDFTTIDDGDIESRYRNQTFFGKIMEQMEPSFSKIQGVLVIEEADVLIPNPRRGGLRPSSNIQMIKFSAKAPKMGMACVLLMQNRDQTDPLIFRGGQWTWLLGLYENYPRPFRGLPNLDGERREFVYVNAFRRWTKITPLVPCCEFESNVRGGMIV